MRILIFFWTVLLGKCVGSDEFGNKYYVYRLPTKKSVHKRWVLYKGIVEASKTPDIYNMWLRGIIKDFPSISQQYSWQKPHLLNLTGTKFATKEKFNKELSYNHYTAWKEKR